MPIWLWLIISSAVMALIAMTGALTMALKESTFKKVTPLLVSLAAGSLIGGALFHMLPRSLDSLGNQIGVFISLAAGFTLFLAMEQILHWHHCHKPPSEHRAPLTYMILIADGLHNFLGGLGIAASFIISPEVGVTALIAAALHEIPQELGDFGVLVHGGWKPRTALLFNFISALSFPVGAFLSYTLRTELDVRYLVPFAAGNFLYIAATDLLPEVKRQTRLLPAFMHLIVFLFGMFILLAVHTLSH